MSPDSNSFCIFAAISGFFRWSCKALGSFCICSRIILMAGSLRMDCTSGSPMARCLIFSGSPDPLAFSMLQVLYPLIASALFGSISRAFWKAPIALLGCCIPCRMCPFRIQPFMNLGSSSTHFSQSFKPRSKAASLV
jgi:hypothetical protein